MMVIIAYLIPESPRWKAQKSPDKLDETRKLLARIRRLPPDDPEVEEEFREIILALEYQRHYEGLSYMDLVKNPAMRKRLAYGIGVMAFAQLCGQQALLYFGILQFDSLGFSGGGWGMNLNLMSSSIQLVSCIFSWVFTERLGRRKLFLIALGVITISYMISGALTDAYPNESNKGANIACVIFIFIIQCSYAGALGALQWVYVGEIFPMNYREKSINLCQGLGQGLTQLWLNQVWPVMFDNLSHNSYWIIAGFNVISFAIFYKFYPETKGVPLEQMDEVFGDENRVVRADRDEREGKGGELVHHVSEIEMVS
jgi:MFS family permease